MNAQWVLLDECEASLYQAPSPAPACHQQLAELLCSKPRDAYGYHLKFSRCFNAFLAWPCQNIVLIMKCLHYGPSCWRSHCSSDRLLDGLPDMQLEEMRAADPTAKALVFSQFNSTIDWLKVKLGEHGFGFRTISGGMTLSKRTKVRWMHLCPAALSCALRTCLMAFLLCMFVLSDCSAFKLASSVL